MNSRDVLKEITAGDPYMFSTGRVAAPSDLRSQQQAYGFLKESTTGILK